MLHRTFRDYYNYIFKGKMFYHVLKISFWFSHYTKTGTSKLTGQELYQIKNST